MKVLVTGYTGQLGYDVVKAGIQAGYDMIGIGSTDLDITDKESVSNFILSIHPDVVVHCAAYTAVDKAEDDRETCYKVNVEGTANLVNAAKKCNAKFVYISTDYVFDGTGTLEFTEEDNVQPIGYYGLTKEQGETIVRTAISNHYIVRISWVFGVNGNNFVKTMLKLAESRDFLNVVGDQYGSPTYTHDVAILIINMIQTDRYGTYHATNEGICSWAEFAQEIFHQSNKKVTVNAIPTYEYPTKADRPLNSRLSKEKLVKNGFNKLPHWKDALSMYLDEIGVKENMNEEY